MKETRIHKRSFTADYMPSWPQQVSSVSLSTQQIATVYLSPLFKSCKCILRQRFLLKSDESNSVEAEKLKLECGNPAWWD